MCINFIDWLGLFPALIVAATAIVTVCVLVRTLKQNNEHHNSSMQLLIQNHNETLDEQNELTRISLMPYLIIERDNIQSEMKDGKLWLTIPFINKGEGAAVQLGEKYKESRNTFPLLSESPSGKYFCIQPFSLEDNIVTKGNKCLIKICGKYKQNESLWRDRLNITILYCDMRLDQYEQSYDILFEVDIPNEKIDITLAKPSFPKLQ